jgi:hypothetical protein
MSNDTAQPPDDLKMKEADDSKFVTEDLAKMKPIVHRLLAGWFVVVAALCIVTILRVWPSVSSTPTAGRPTMAKDLTSKADTLARVDTARTEVSQTENASSLDQYYLFIALLFGILGGASHGLASLMDFRGQRRLFCSWSLWYFALPFLGGMLALIVYVTIRAGLLTGAGDVTGSISLYGVAAFSAIVGLFTDRATNKLKEVIETIFATKSPPRGDQLTATKPSSGDQAQQ